MTKPIALITGATSGIGRATAERFAKDGYNVIITGRRTERLANIADELSQAYQTNILPLTLDVQNNEQVKQAISDLSEEWQAITVLVNNAGTALTTDTIQDGDPANWDIMIDTNIKGLLYVTRAILPGMLQRENGHIINIGSTAGHECYPGGNVYCATKHAVKAINKTLRIDLIGKPIRVTSIDPGMVHTEFSAVRWDDAEKGDKLYADMVPLQARDIADAVAYVAQVPKHVNVETMVVMPTAQASTTLVHRENASDASVFGAVD